MLKQQCMLIKTYNKQLQRIDLRCASISPLSSALGLAPYLAKEN
jgi:hypothetical protein